jgi:hypothetical protein
MSQRASIQLLSGRDPAYHGVAYTQVPTLPHTCIEATSDFMYVSQALVANTGAARLQAYVPTCHMAFGAK